MDNDNQAVVGYGYRNGFGLEIVKDINFCNFLRISE